MKKQRTPKSRALHRQTAILLFMAVLGSISVGYVHAAANPGVVIEDVAKSSEAAKAELRSGDVLLRWNRGDSEGEINSPFDLFWIEVEQAPRGIVTLQGTRAAEQHQWTIGPDDWGIKARPELPQNLLTLYEEGQKLAKAGRLTEVAEHWRNAALEAERSEHVCLAAWLFFQSAEQMVKAQQWENANTAYQQVLDLAMGNCAHAEMQVLFSWANAYNVQGDNKNAEKYYEMAVQRRSKIDDADLMSAFGLNKLGLLAWQIGDLEQAINFYNRSLAIREKLAPESLVVASTANNLGLIAVARGELSKAQELYLKSLAIRQRLAPESSDVAGSLSNLGNLERELGNLEEAERYQYEALTIDARRNPDSPDVAEDYEDLGSIAWSRGNLRKAEENYRKAFSIVDKVSPNSILAASCLQNIGLVLEERWDLDGAERYSNRAGAIFRKMAPRSLYLAGALNTLGSIATHRDNLPQARKYYEEALEIAENNGPSATYALFLNNVGSVADQQGDLAIAEEYFQRSLAIQEKVAPGGLSKIEILNNLGDMALKHGDQSKAEQYLRQSLEIGRKLAPESSTHAATLVLLASLSRQKGQLDAAEQLYQQAVDALEGQTAHLGGSADIRAGFRSRFSDYYRQYMDLLISEKKTARAFEVLEQSRARALLETLNAAHADVHTGVDSALLQKEQSLQELLSAKSDRRVRLLIDGHSSGDLAAIDKEIKDLLAEYKDIEEQIRIDSPGYSALTQPKVLGIEDIQRQLLDSETVLLEYALGEDHSYVFVLTFGALSVQELPDKAKIEDVARQVYKLLREIQTERSSSIPQSHTTKHTDAKQITSILSQMILGPIADQLVGKRLIIVSDGALQYIPFGALPEPSPGPRSADRLNASIPLIAGHEIVNLPSASVLAALRQPREGRKTNSKEIAVLADPVFDRRDERVTQVVMTAKSAPEVHRDTSDTDLSAERGRLTRSLSDVGFNNNAKISLPRLPFTRREAKAILSVTPPGQGMEALDFNASRATALNPELAQYRIVHFATHGLMNSEHPELSGLVFSMVDRQGNPLNGFLDLADIYNLNLPADLVVLSACETALGKEIHGEGLLGLTRGFMYAGASRVLATLWNADDVATAELMERFYKGINQDGMYPAAALRQAQIQMWKQKRWADPYYWAGFELQGEWK